MVMAWFVTTWGLGTMSSPGSVIRRSSGVDLEVWPRCISPSSVPAAAVNRTAPTFRMPRKIKPIRVLLRYPNDLVISITSEFRTARFLWGRGGTMVLDHSAEDPL